MLQAHPSYLFCCGSFFMSLAVEDPFCEVPVFFVDGFSADSCDFGVLPRGDELWVFLLCHLGFSPPCS